MTDAKVQHYVPQFLLRGFARASDGRLHVLDKHTDRQFVARVERVAAEKAFYDLALPEGMLTFEPALGNLESAAALVVQTIRTNGSIAPLTVDDRHTLAVFIAAQHLRTQHFRAQMLDADRQLATQLREQGHDLETIANYKPFGSDDEVKAQSISVLARMTHVIAKLLLDKDWFLFHTSPDDPFIIGDHPVALHNHRDYGFYGNIGFAVPGIEVHLPLQDTLALCITCTTNTSGLRDIPQKLALIRGVMGDTQELRELEARLAPTLKAMNENVPIEVSHENVIRHNALQVNWAERWLFSATDDFAIAHQMFADDARYRRGPRSQVG
jgi:hypothetical protein